MDVTAQRQTWNSRLIFIFTPEEDVASFQTAQEHTLFDLDSPHASCSLGNGILDPEVLAVRPLSLPCVGEAQTSFSLPP